MTSNGEEKAVVEVAGGFVASQASTRGPLSYATGSGPTWAERIVISAAMLLMLILHRSLY